MGELFGAFERLLGTVLNSIYEATGSYLVAIIVLTLVVRGALIPLTVKQTRSMKKMQELAPQTKELQRKFKERQQKAKDRAELQQIRLEMNREMQLLYKSAGVNPLGGCLPLIAQMPVFIAMFAIMRASLSVLPQTASLVEGGDLAEAFEGRDLKTTICRPYDVDAGAELPPMSNGTPTTIQCETEGDGEADEPVVVEIGDFEDKDGSDLDEAPWISQCVPFEDDGEIGFNCRSALGTGHVPPDGELFSDLSVDEATIAGMYPGCSASAGGSDSGVRACTSTKDSAGTGGAIPYYILIAFIVVTQYYTARQVQSRQSQVTDQQRMMTRMMPVIFGFISLSLPAGVNTYYAMSNVFTLGQQAIMFRGQKPTESAPKKAIESRPAKQKPSQQGKPSTGRPNPQRGRPKGKRRR